MEAISNSQKKNKGFTIYVGDTLIGFLNIWEKNVPANTVLALQNPANMVAVLDKAELRPYKPAEMVDTSTVDSIIAATQTATATQAIVESAEGVQDADSDEGIDDLVGDTVEPAQAQS